MSSAKIKPNHLLFLKQDGHAFWNAGSTTFLAFSSSSNGHLESIAAWDRLANKKLCLVFIKFKQEYERIAIY